EWVGQGSSGEADRRSDAPGAGGSVRSVARASAASSSPEAWGRRACLSPDHAPHRLGCKISGTDREGVGDALWSVPSGQGEPVTVVAGAVRGFFDLATGVAGRAWRSGVRIGVLETSAGRYPGAAGASAGPSAPGPAELPCIGMPRAVERRPAGRIEEAEPSEPHDL